MVQLQLEMPLRSDPPFSISVFFDTKKKKRSTREGVIKLVIPGPLTLPLKLYAFVHHHRAPVYNDDRAGGCLRRLLNDRSECNQSFAFAEGQDLRPNI